MCQTDGLNWKRTELNAGSTCSLLIDITALAGFLFLGAGITAKGSLRLLHYRQHSSKFYSFNVRNLFPSRQVFNISTMSPEASGMQGWECRPSWSVQTETTTWWIAVKSRRHFWPSEDESHQLWWSTDHFCSTTSAFTYHPPHGFWYRYSCSPQAVGLWPNTCNYWHSIKTQLWLLCFLLRIGRCKHTQTFINKLNWNGEHVNHYTCWHADVNVHTWFLVFSSDLLEISSYTKSN